MKRSTRPLKISQKQRKTYNSERQYDFPSRLLKPVRGKPKFDQVMAELTELPCGAEPLAELDYADELALKRVALEEFSRQHNLPKFNDIIASPMPRFYRTTTKRRVVFAPRSRPRLAFGDERPSGGYSLLEPESHAYIYEGVEYMLRSASARKFADSLTHIILRGSYDEHCLIFNTARRSAALTKLLLDWSKEIAAEIPALVSALEFLDDSRSDYYLDAEAKTARGAWKRLFGSGKFSVPVGSFAFQASAKVFSQVNQSMLPVITSEVARLLRPEGRPLIDLFCGYGLFALSLAAGSGRVTGIEYDADAIILARRNAERLGVENARFFRRFINDETFAELLPFGRTGEIFILDPPRNGVGSEITAAIAQRKPRRIAHIFCNIEEIPSAVADWQLQGYKTSVLVPLDMFAGTPAVETIALLDPV
ncbi:MAG: methyltransferase domain-containing protein [Bacteroidetes bacterium]|nr:class I SAM-dependent RNA methyltransferase [Bacteroidota bacterium]MCZ2133020.1 methyltransferase domain-containing protein [Bacteroidota bacterium]